MLAQSIADHRLAIKCGIANKLTRQLSTADPIEYIAKMQTLDEPGDDTLRVSSVRESNPFLSQR